MSINNVLLTGSNGFIGQVLLQQLQAAKFKVKNIVRKPNNNIPNSIVLDLTSEWNENPCIGMDTVFHLAGKAHALSEISHDNEEYQRINTEVTRKLLEAAQQAGVQRFIFFSSVKAVGDSEIIQDETSQLPADTPYGQSKYAAEQLVLQGNYVPHPVVIRPCMVYGNSKKGNLPKMINAISKGFFPPLPEVNNHRSMVHVKDVAQAAILAVNNPQAAGQIYIVSDGIHYSSKQLYDLICQTLGKPNSRFIIPLTVLNSLAKLGDLIGKLSGRRFIFDSDSKQKLLGSAHYSSLKIETELGFKPHNSLQQALPDIVQYLKQ